MAVIGRRAVGARHQNLDSARESLEKSEISRESRISREARNLDRTQNLEICRKSRNLDDMQDAFQNDALSH